MGPALAITVSKVKSNRSRAKPADPGIVRELITVARKERASLHSLVATLGDQICHSQELIKYSHGLIARLDEVLLLLEKHGPSRMAEVVRKSQASASANGPNK